MQFLKAGERSKHRHMWRRCCLRRRLRLRPALGPEVRLPRCLRLAVGGRAEKIRMATRRFHLRAALHQGNGLRLVRPDRKRAGVLSSSPFEAAGTVWPLREGSWPDGRDAESRSQDPRGSGRRAPKPRPGHAGRAWLRRQDLNLHHPAPTLQVPPRISQTGGRSVLLSYAAKLITPLAV